MTLNELGALLLEARTRHNLSAQEMADRLKLPVSTIQAIEEGNLKGLPHPAYARGFIKAYASMVGVPADLVHEALSVLVEEETPPDQLITRSSRMASFAPPRIDGGAMLRLIGLLVMMAIAAAVFWFREPLVTQAVDLWNSVTSQQQTSQPSATLPAADAPATDDAASHHGMTPEAAPATAASEISDAGTTGMDAPAAPEATRAQAAFHEETAEPQGETTATAATNAQTTPTTATPANAAINADESSQLQPSVAPGESHKLVINAVATCWVMVRPDSAKPTEFSLRKGEGATFTFNKSLTLRLGNAGGVRLTYDGKAMGSPGAQGQVRTLTFPPAP